MSLLDKIVASITPLESDEERLRARENARTQAVQGGWVHRIIDDHDRIERAFEAVRSAPDATAQKAAERELATLLNGHSAAEEAVIYPELVDTSQKGHATLGYEEQAATKVQLGLLGKIEPMTQDYLDKLEHIRGAVTHHMYQEENSWLVTLEREILSERQQLVLERYEEEMSRYASRDAARGARADAPAAMSWGNG
jgi:hemerythrin superfamily protein